MLFAYALSGEITLTAEVIQELRQVADGLAAENLPHGVRLGFTWDSLIPGTRAEGVFLRGYQQVNNRTQALWLTHCLRRLSQRFPQYRIYMSGWGNMPMTELDGGNFLLFAESYERDLANLAADHTQPLRRRISS